MSGGQSGLGERLALVRERIERACGRCGRDPAEITLVAVSKTFPAADVETAYGLGLGDFGENRVQEGAAKAIELSEAGMHPQWHLIGHLQTNKAGLAVRHFGVVHSVDSERVLAAISKHAGRDNPTRIFIEVNVAGEATKSGIRPDEVMELAGHARSAEGVILQGLMTVAPHAGAEAARPIFRELRRLAGGAGVGQLSMGMSEDFDVAIEEGATHLRIGRAIFGGRA